MITRIIKGNDEESGCELVTERACEGEFSFGMEPFSFGARASTARLKEKASGG